ncbi:glycoside hydrolase [Ramicandelaber brevisporus]|nr:glycoside hydrolase [Ramicandelaber brevisporus]
MHQTTIILALALSLLFIGAVSGLTHAVDSSTLGNGFTKAIIRGYQEACGSGGRVDPNFVSSYNNARAADFTDIDAYWFPCTGANNACKSFSTQLSEISATFRANKMKIGRIWVDIEKYSVCNGWNYGTSGNFDEAKELMKALRASGFKFGIYSSPREWGSIFGSTSVVLDNTVPLWFATYNNVETLELKTPFGGWTEAVGHQYTDKSASRKFDLSVFA